MKTIDMRSLIDKIEANSERINEIADVCEKENRDRTEAEIAEFQQLARENDVLRMKMQVLNTPKVEAPAEYGAEIREALNAGKRFERAVNVTAGFPTLGFQGIQEQDIVKPLYEGLILNQVGLPFQTGLRGSFVWPVYAAAKASIAGEGVALSQTTISLSELVATPERMGISVSVSREAINRSMGTIENVIRQMLPDAVSALINEVMFSTTKVTGASNLVGPFVGLAVAAAKGIGPSAAPDATAINKLKASVLKSGVSGEKCAWVMTKATEAILETSPISSKGVYKPIAENHMMFGYPIFTTEYIGDGNIGFGDWAYQPVGLFGDMDLIVDPYTEAANGAVVFTLNADFATKTLRPAAFAFDSLT